jgi:LysM repeat protein
MRRIRLVLGAALVVAATVFPAVAHAAGKECIHTVTAGQTLGHIANKHGVSQRELIETNPALKKNPDLLRVGQELDVCAAKALAAAKGDATASKVVEKGSEKDSVAPKKPKSCGSGGQLVEHEVTSGETLEEIAEHYAVTKKEIFRRNPKVAEAPHMLRVGQTIKICADQQRATNSKLCEFQSPTYLHEVVPGENLGMIAGRYGVRRADLQRWNSKLRKDPDLLSVGQKVQVCPEIAPRERKQIAYEVRPGDTLGEIAERYDLTRRELVRFQRGKLDDPSSLRPGQELAVWVDGGVVPGFGTDDRDRGTLVAGVLLSSSKHIQVKWEAGAWGTDETIRSIQSAVAAYKQKLPGGPKVFVGDISKKGGGPFKPHSSHQHGRDVDVGYVLEGQGSDGKFRTATADNLDVARTWRLVKSFIDTEQVVYVFMDYKLQKLLYEYAQEQGASEEFLDEIFQYPRGRRRMHGLVRHWPGHTNHFHVRFRK